jgi:hypothetical protein
MMQNGNHAVVDLFCEGNDALTIAVDRGENVGT